MKRKAELEEKLAEQTKSREDFLFAHEIDTRKDAIDKETEAYTESLETRIKELENMLSKEGHIRQMAVDMINEKSEQFYNDLLNYTLTYTDRSRASFQQLWSDAYDAILKFAGGEIDVDLALMNILSSMRDAELELKNIENSLDSIKNATTKAKDEMLEYKDVVADTAADLKDMNNQSGNSGLRPLNGDAKLAVMRNALARGINAAEIIKLIKDAPPYHTGGIVEGTSSEHGEILAKLLSGEVVATENQARQFMEKTLPKLASSNVTNNNPTIAPVINLGDINISGNADQSVIDKLKAVQKDIADSVLKAVNNQTNIYNGGRVRFV